MAVVCIVRLLSPAAASAPRGARCQHRTRRAGRCQRTGSSGWSSRRRGIA